MDKVFVTGANGLLGTNLVSLLLGEGFSVVAMVRKRESFVLSEVSNLKLVEGSLADVAFLESSIRGCRYAVHVAANISQKLLKLSDYYSANVQGTKNFLEACLRCNVHKVVYVSTANIFGYGSEKAPGNERVPMKYPFTCSLYALSKKQAQDVVDNMSEKLNVTTVCPSFMLGPYDVKLSSGRIVQRALGRSVILYPPGGKSFVSVRDVAVSIVKAFDIKEPGGKFIISNDNMTYRIFYEKLLKVLGQKSFLIFVPVFVLKLVGAVGDILRYLGYETELSSVNMAALCAKTYYDNEKAKNILGMEFSSIDEVLADTIDYFLNVDG